MTIKMVDQQTDSATSRATPVPWLRTIMFEKCVFICYLLRLLLLITSLCHSCKFDFNCSCILSIFITILFLFYKLLCIFCLLSSFICTYCCPWAAATWISPGKINKGLSYRLSELWHSFIENYCRNWNYLSLLSKRFLKITLIRGILPFY